MISGSAHVCDIKWTLVNQSYNAGRHVILEQFVQRTVSWQTNNSIHGKVKPYIDNRCFKFFTILVDGVTRSWSSNWGKYRAGVALDPFQMTAFNAIFAL